MTPTAKKFGGTLLESVGKCRDGMHALSSSKHEGQGVFDSLPVPLSLSTTEISDFALDPLEGTCQGM